MPNIYIGPMSKNIVDSIIEFSNETQSPVGLIPSRRQIDFSSGYVNNWTTETFSKYVKAKAPFVVLQRDHGGPNQGDEPDMGLESFDADCQFLDLIHIDPWKYAETFEKGCVLTNQLIKYCEQMNPDARFEVGTEQAIFPYSSDHLDFLLTYLKSTLTERAFKNIVFAVIQSGTSLKGNTNTGVYDKTKLEDMITICKKHGVLSKEHNGDYLPPELVKEKFDVGLDGINIAPEYGQIETQTYLNEIKNRNLNLIETYFEICYASKKWVKWVDKSFDPQENKEELINICGHYVLSYPEFIEERRPNDSHNLEVAWYPPNYGTLSRICDGSARVQLLVADVYMY